MKVADLFVKIGLDGDRKVSAGLRDVNKSMSGAVAKGNLMADALKAAGKAFVKFSKSGLDTGTELTTFAARTGLSIKKLQEFQFAGEQMGLSSKELQGNIQNLQKKMSDMLALGEVNLEGFGIIGSFVELDQEKSKDPFHLIVQSQKFAMKALREGMPHGEVASILQRAGFTENMLAPLMDGAFNAKNFKNAPIIGANEAKRLHQTGVAYKNLGKTINRAFLNFTGKNSTSIIKFIQDMIPPVTKLAEALVGFAEKTNFFEHLGKAFEGITDVMNTFIKTLEDLNIIEKTNENADASIKGFVKDVGKGFRNALSFEYQSVVKGRSFGFGQSALPTPRVRTGEGAKPNITINNNQSITTPDTEGTRRAIEQGTSDGIKGAYLQVSGSTQES